MGNNCTDFIQCGKVVWRENGQVKYGGYGVMVNTEVCGTFNSGSIPDSHPIDIFDVARFATKWRDKKWVVTCPTYDKNRFTYFFE